MSVPAAGSGREKGRAAAPPRRSSGLLRLAAAGVVTLALGFAGGFTIFASYVSELREPRIERSADAIIVLTGGQARLDAGVGLLKAGKGRRLLISGVHPAAGREALSAATGGDRRLFSCCVDIDHAAMDTIGNAEESAKWVRDHRYGSVILVTNNYHMPRSLLEMGRLMEDAELIPYPVVNSNLANGGWLSRPDAMRVLVTEYAKYLAALARGVLPLRPAAEDYAFVEAASSRR